MSYWGHVLGRGNYIVAKVNGVKMVLTSAEMQRLINAGYDIEVMG